MKEYVSHAIFTVIFLAILFLIALPVISDWQTAETDQEKIARIVQEEYLNIDQHRIDGRPLSLDEAAVYLYCWADKNSGEEISDEMLREAIWVVLACNDEIHDLIYGIDEIDLDDY